MSFATLEEAWGGTTITDTNPGPTVESFGPERAYVLETSPTRRTFDRPPRARQQRSSYATSDAACAKRYLVNAYRTQGIGGVLRVLPAQVRMQFQKRKRFSGFGSGMFEDPELLSDVLVAVLFVGLAIFLLK